MRSPNWSLVFLIALALGILAGYIITLIFRPSLLPLALRFGSLREPATVLFLGTDVVYEEIGRQKKVENGAFNGRSDTIMVARLDPYRNALGVLSIPRDTRVYINGFGQQKINAANALGGPKLACDTVSSLLQLPIDHYVILNVCGLVELINELGGITVEIPKRMKYMDWTAKLKIDLEPGFHTLTGNQAMGFVRFRHDALGDIGRVQRQEIFIRAILDQALKPQSWSHLPRLMEIAQKYIDTDLSFEQLMQLATFVRAVPKKDQYLAMLPGSFAANGDWLATRSDIRRIMARLIGASFINTERGNLRIAIINASSSNDLGYRLMRFLRAKGYGAVFVKPAEEQAMPLKRSRFIAQMGNPEDAGLVRDDLRDCGDVVNASVGDIESAVTILAGEDLASLIPESVSKVPSTN